MTTPANSTNPYQRFKTMIDEIIHGKPKKSEEKSNLDSIPEEPE